MGKPGFSYCPWKDSKNTLCTIMKLGTSVPRKEKAGVRREGAPQSSLAAGLPCRWPNS